jgi:hypothetical protein
MKKIMFLAFVCLIGTMAVSAQDKMDTGKMDKMKMEHKMKDCVMMKHGKMMVMKKGETMAMMQDMTMSNGTMVMTDGSVKMKDGTMSKMGEGDCMYMNGKMKKMAMTKKM